MSFNKRGGGTWGMGFIPASSHPEPQTANQSGKSSQDNAIPAAIRGPKPGINRQGYNSEHLAISPPKINYSAGASNRAFSNLGRKRVVDEDNYFNEDENADLPYIPADGSPTRIGEQEPKEADDGSDDDPLDKFMQGIEKEVKDINKPKQKKGERFDLEKEDELESYLRFMEENPHVGVTGDEEEIYEYDADGNVIAHEKKAIDPLPPIDHATINYEPFNKNFYNIHPDIATLDFFGISDLRDKLGIKVRGINPIAPVCSFAHLNLDEPLLEAIRKAGYSKPTPIQAQAVPVALSGRDIIGVAKTGSGKTAAFLWPMVVHVLDQPELKEGDGPIGIVCAPTRELAQQIYHEAKKAAKPYNLTVVCTYGGGNLWEQMKACETGCEILICTPGRLIELVKRKSTNLRRVTYLVFDEADKMFNLGFENQVRSIANHVRPDRQTLLFSATFRSKIERLARDILVEPLKIVQGSVGEANEDITQFVEVMANPDEKWNWLSQHLVQFTTEGSVIIFVTRKVNADELAQRLKGRDFKLLLLHGDMHQSERNSVIQSFKKLEAPILVATDVASRGLDIPQIATVVNYEVARDIDTHVHRVGRTGRAGKKGKAFTLYVSGRDSVDFAAQLVRHLETSNQRVPEALLRAAEKCTWFMNCRNKVLSGGEVARPGIGFTPREKKPEAPSDSSSEGRSTTQSDQSFSASAQMTSTDRVSAMRDAFSAQFNRRFVSAGVDGKHFVNPLERATSQPEVKDQKKRSRWD